MSFPVDFVYTWVDGSDVDWQARRSQAKYGKSLHEESDEECRYSNNDELLYAVRSVYKHCPWFHKIYIVTDKQVPAWLKCESSDIVVVDHTDIFGDEGTLPTFNSSVIESRIHHIKELSEHFIMLNDDFFIGRDVSQNFFFSESGEPRLYVSTPKQKKQVLLDIKKEQMTNQDLYYYRVNSTIKLVYEKLGYLPLHNPIHNPRPFRKSDLQRVEKLFYERISETWDHQFRNVRGLTYIGLCQFYMMAQGVKPIVIKPYRKNKPEYHLSLFRKNREYVYINLGGKPSVNEMKYQLIRKYKPAFICINDANTSTVENKQRMRAFLNELYPERVSCEK